MEVKYVWKCPALCAVTSTGIQHLIIGCFCMLSQLQWWVDTLDLIFSLFQNTICHSVLFWLVLMYLFFKLFKLWGSKVAMVSGVIQMLICKTHKSWEKSNATTTTAALSINPTPTSTKAKAAWPLGNAAETAADGRGCRWKCSALKLGPFS